MRNGYLKVFSPAFFFCMGIAFLLLSCVKLSDKSNEDTIADQPVTISGRPTICSFDNCRIRCGYEEIGTLEYKIYCRVVVIDEKDNEYIATSVQPGLSLNWSDSQSVIKDKALTRDCTPTDPFLSQQCNISLSDTSPTRIRTKITIVDTINGRDTSELDEILLPYSVTSYGFIPQMPISFSPLKSEFKPVTTTSLKEKALVVTNTQGTPEIALPAAVGFQSPDIDPKNFAFKDIINTCFDNGRLFFSTKHYIYALEEGMVKLFAGSGNPLNEQEFSHRLRVRLSPKPQIACKNGKFYVFDGNRILQINESNKVSLLINYNKLLGLKSGTHPLGTSISLEFAIGHDNTLYIVTPYMKSILKFNVVTGKISTINKEPLTCQPDTQNSSLIVNSISVSKDGFVYVSPPNQECVVKINETTGETVAIFDINAYDLKVAPDGSLYFADGFSNLIKKMSPSENITTVMGNGEIFTDDENSDVNIEGKPAKEIPIGATGKTFKRHLIGKLTLGSNGVLYFLSTAYHGILKVVKREDGGETVSFIMRESINDKPLPEAVSANTSQIKNAQDIAVTSDGSLLIADTSNHLIRRIFKSADGKDMIETIAGTGEAGFSGDRRPAKEALLNRPQGVAIGPDGNVYIADTFNHRIRMIDSDSGNVSTIAGTGDPLIQTRNGELATKVNISFPRTIAIDSQKSVYFLDSMEEIRKIYPEVNGGRRITTITTIFDIPNPQAVAVGPDDELYVADGIFNQIFVYRNGNWSVIAGLMQSFSWTSRVSDISGSDISVDTEIAKNAILFLTRTKLSVDEQGKVYFTDGEGKSLRVLTPKPLSPGKEREYSISTIFDAHTSSIDCGNGVKSGKTNKEELDGKLQTTLSVICSATILSVSARNNCEDGGAETLAFSQTFEDNNRFSERDRENSYSQVIKVEKPCAK